MTLGSLSDAAFGDFHSVSDLNGEQALVQSGSFAVAGDCDVRWQDIVRPDHGLPSVEDLPPHRRSAWRRLPRQNADLRMTVMGSFLTVH